MEDREVLLKLIEDYPNLINSLEGVTDLPKWLIDFREAIGSIYRGDCYEVAENLKFLILYLFDQEGFFIHIDKSGDYFYVQLGYTKGDLKSIKGDLKSIKGAIAVFHWFQSPNNNEQAIREKLLKNIIRDFRPSIPKEKEILQKVIYNCKVISSEVKRWIRPW